MGDLLSFRRMVTPVLIQLIFWLGILGCLGGGGWYTWHYGMQNLENPSPLSIQV